MVVTVKMMLMQIFLLWKDLTKIWTRSKVSRFDHSSPLSQVWPFPIQQITFLGVEIAHGVPMTAQIFVENKNISPTPLNRPKKNSTQYVPEIFCFSEAVHWKNQEAVDLLISFWIKLFRVKRSGKYFLPPPVGCFADWASSHLKKLQNVGQQTWWWRWEAFLTVESTD